MDSKFVSISLRLVVILFLRIVWEVHGQPNVFRVTNYGAVADGKTDSSNAIMSAWGKACQTDGGILVIPSGTFLVKAAIFEGPCNGKTHFHLNGTLIANPGSTEDYWIQFHIIDYLKIFGGGTFDGNGASAWSRNDCIKNSNCKLPPVSVWLGFVNNSLIHNVKSVNSKSFHFHIAACENLVMHNVSIETPADSPNTDGIHIGKSRNITIVSSHIATGDDCVSIGDGNTNINITDMWCGPGHGISIGSLGKYGNEEDVRSITIRNCTLSDTNNGLRIKTYSHSLSSVTVSNVTFSDIQVNNVQNPIIIDQYYCPHSSCTMSPDSSVLIKDVKFIDVKGTSATEVAVDVRCSKARPCQGVVFSGLDLKFNLSGNPTTASCSSCNNEFLGSGQVPSQCS